VDTAFWLLLFGALLLVVGGLLMASMNFATIRNVVPVSVTDTQVHNALVYQRGVGVVCVLAGAGLGFLTGRTRRGDARFRRACIGLALVTVVLVALAAVFAVIHVLALVSLLPIIVGALLLTRPAVAAWFGAVHG